MRRVQTQIEQGAIMSTCKQKESRQTQRDRAGDLRERIPVLLANGGMSTKHMTAALNADPGVLYRVLNAMRVAGKVESKFDGTMTSAGRSGTVWSLPASRLPRDPWIWALHGAQP
jgi:hypothetical protein